MQRHRRRRRKYIFFTCGGHFAHFFKAPCSFRFRFANFVKSDRFFFRFRFRFVFLVASVSFSFSFRFFIRTKHGHWHWLFLWEVNPREWGVVACGEGGTPAGHPERSELEWKQAKDVQAPALGHYSPSAIAVGSESAVGDRIHSCASIIKNPR